MNDLMVFNNVEFGEIRVVNVNNEPYFIGKDVASALQYKNTRDALIKHVDDEDKADVVVYDGRQNRKMVAINESGVYSLIFGSKLESAKKFKRWVTSEVLVQIRQTGGYIPTNEEDDDETIMAKALLIANKTIEKHKEIIANQRKQLEEQQPMVDFANAIAETSDSIDVGTFSKLLKDENIFVGGRNKLFQWLRDNKFLMKDNEPYQKYIDNGVFEYVEYTYKTPYGEKLGHKTKISPRGQIYLVEKLRKIFK